MSETKEVKEGQKPVIDKSRELASEVVKAPVDAPEKAMGEKAEKALGEMDYSGPPTTLFLSQDKTKELRPGKSYKDLPAENPQVKNLMAQKLLTPKDGSSDKS